MNWSRTVIFQRRSCSSCVSRWCQRGCRLSKVIILFKTLEFMTSLCRLPDHTALLLENPTFCKFIRLDSLNKDLVLNQVHEQENINQSILNCSSSEQGRPMRFLSLSSNAPLSNISKFKDETIKDFVQLLNEERDQISQYTKYILPYNIDRGLEKYLITE